MNGPFVVAQANTGASSATPVQVLKLFKPQAGHTEIFHASFTGTVKIDFTAIANEKIVLYHDSKNQSLHIIFADGSQIIIEPFFDSRGTILANLIFEMTPNEFYSGQEFAQKFTVTEDPSVLPAAGDTVVSGADFEGFSVDLLPGNEKLALLPPEELPGIDFTVTEAPTFLNAELLASNLIPTIGAPVTGIVEEEQLNTDQFEVLQPSDAGPGNEDVNDVDGNDTDFAPPVTQTASGTLAGTVVGGDLPITFSLSAVEGAPVGITSIGESVTYHVVSSTTVEGWTAFGTPEARLIFTLFVATDGAFIFTLNDQIDHPIPSLDVGSISDGSLEETLFIDFSGILSAHDATNDPVVFPAGIFTIGVIDDTPIVNVGSADAVLPPLNLDETIDPDHNATAGDHQDTYNGVETESGGGTPNGDDDDTGLAAVNGTDPIGSLTTAPGALAGLFSVTLKPGADNTKSADYDFALNLSANGAATSLSITLSEPGGNPDLAYTDRTIRLVQVDATHVIGFVDVDGGTTGQYDDGVDAIALTITLNDPDTTILGDETITFEQILAIDHGDDNNQFDTEALLTLVDGTLDVSLTATLTDLDNDTATSEQHLVTLIDGENSPFSIDDDGPSAVTVGEGSGALADIALNLDETIDPDHNATAGDHQDTYNGVETESGGGTPNGDDDDTGLAAVNGTDPIGSLTTAPGALAGLFSVGTLDAGTDGEKSADYAFAFNLSLNGAATNLFITEAEPGGNPDLPYTDRTISLVQVDATHVIGFVDVDGGTTGQYDDGVDAIALTITLNDPDTTILGDETITFEQILAIDHGDDNNQFDTEALLKLVGGATLDLGLTVTLTDGDTDFVQGEHSVTLIDGDNSSFSIDDDGPSISSATADIILDDEGQPLAQLSPDAPEDVDTPENAKTVSGTLSFAAGTDGFKAIAVDTSVTTTDSNSVSGAVSIIYVDPADENHGTSEAVTFTWVPDLGGDGGTLVGTSTHYDALNPAITLRVHANGNYELTLNAPLDHPYTDPDFLNNGPELGYEDNLTLNFTYTVTDGDTDTAPAVLSVNVDDDKPVAFTPEDAVLSNTPGSQNFLLHVFGNTGADGLGTVVFTGIANGAVATGIPQGSGDPLTSGGEPIYLYFGSNGTDQTILIGSTITPLEFNNGSGINPSTEAIFQISLNPDAAFAPGDLYTVQVFAPVDNGAGITFDDFSEIGSPGHTDFLVADLPGTQDLIVQGTVTGNHVNTAAFNSSVDIGVDNQWIDEAQGVILDFVELNNVASNPPGISGHNTVNGGSFTIAQVKSGGGTADVFVRAFTVDDDNDYEPRISDPQDTSVAITGITVNGIAVAGTAFDPGDGFGSGFVLENLSPSDVVIVTTATGFQRLEISNANDLGGPNAFDGDDFSVTALGVQTVTAGSPVVLSYDLLMTDGDGDGVIGTLQVGLEPAAPPLVQTSAFSGIVEEEQLGHVDSPLYFSSFTGNEDQTATPDNDLDTANSGANSLITREFVSGSYGVTGGTGPYTFHFDTSFEGAQAQFADAPFGITSHGSPVLLHFDGSTLFGYTNVGGAGYTEGVDHVVFTYQITNPSTGAATFTLYDNLDHHTVAAADDVEGTRALNLNGIVQVTDSSPSALTIALNGSVGIIDDIPVATNNTASVNEGGTSITDLLLIIDTSASMGEDPGVPGFATRLDLEKAALINLINSDNVDEVFIVSFNTSATDSGGWLSKAAAITYINGLTAFGLTNYDAALADAETAFTFAHTPADQTLSYFLSDGVPTWPFGSIGISASEQATWESFLTTNGIADSFAVGIGSDANLNALQPVAFPNGDPNNPILLTDESLIVPTLPGLLPGTVTGNVLIDDSGFGVDGFGADGRGAGAGIISITVDGHIYVYDSVANAITKDAIAFAAGGTLDINTALTGHLTFHFVDSVGFAAGDWQYKSPADVNADTVETFHYVIADGDGDQAGADLAVTIYATNQPPVAFDDAVITNISGSGAAIAIPDLALLLNDTDLNGPTLTISSVGSAASGSVAHLGLTTTFTDNNSTGGSFDYTLQDLGSPNLTDTGHVTVDRAQAGESQLDGTSANEILIGRAGTADTLIGGLGNDVLYGNTGADHFRYNAPSEGLDHILDFNMAEGDAIDILASAFGGGLTAGTDASGMFGSSVNNNFGSVDERFHLNTVTHTLLYDSNGSAGGGTQVALAVLENNGSVDAAHIHMV